MTITIKISDEKNTIAVAEILSRIVAQILCAGAVKPSKMISRGITSEVTIDDNTPDEMLRAAMFQAVGLGQSGPPLACRLTRT